MNSSPGEPQDTYEAEGAVEGPDAGSWGSAGSGDGAGQGEGEERFEGSGAGGSDEEGKPLVDVRVVLEHLEGFRWFFIKSVAVVLVVMAGCLVASNRVVELLKWPLRQAQRSYFDKTPAVYLALSTNQVRRLPVPGGSFWGGVLGSNQAVWLRLMPVERGTNRVLGFEAVPAEAGLVAGLGQVRLNNYGPVGAFVVALQVAFFGGLVVASPLVFYFLAQFVAPMLGPVGVFRRGMRRWVSGGVLLFLTGVFFCFFVLLPVSLYGSVGFAQWMNFGADEWRAESYIGFICKFMLGMGVGFELPLIILLLERVGLLNCARLRKFRPYWVVLDLVCSAALTPDASPLTMALMAAPLWLLYEISLLVVWHRERRAAKAQPKQEAQE